jgi:hypothetical protein
MLARLVGGVMMIHHLVLWRSTTGRSCHNHCLLALLVGADCIIRDDDVVDELWEGSASSEHHALLKLRRETIHEAVLLLLFHVHLIWCIIRQMVEQL